MSTSDFYFLTEQLNLMIAIFKATTVTEAVQVGVNFTNQIVINYVFLMDSINNNLNILNKTARSLNGKEDELFNFLTAYNMHIAVITETYLKPGSKLKRDPNFFVYRNDRLDGACGGVAIIIHRRIKHQPFSSFETKVFETLGVSVET